MDRFEFYCLEHGLIASDVSDPILQRDEVPVSCPECSEPVRFRLRQANKAASSGSVASS
jgi:hypothetical protein